MRSDEEERGTLVWTRCWCIGNLSGLRLTDAQIQNYSISYPLWVCHSYRAIERGWIFQVLGNIQDPLQEPCYFTRKKDSCEKAVKHPDFWRRKSCQKYLPVVCDDSCTSRDEISPIFNVFSCSMSKAYEKGEWRLRDDPITTTEMKIEIPPALTGLQRYDSCMNAWTSANCSISSKEGTEVDRDMLGIVNE